MPWSRTDVFVEYVIKYIARGKLKDNTITRYLGPAIKATAERVALKTDIGVYCRLCGAGPYRQSVHISKHFREHWFEIKDILLELKDGRRKGKGRKKARAKALAR